MKQAFLIRFIIFSVALFFLSTAEAATVDDIQSTILKEDFVKAKSLSTEILSTSLSNQEKTEVQYFLALSDLYLGEYKKALDIFKDVAGKTEDIDLHDQALIGVVNAYYLEGDYAQALKQANQLLESRLDSNFLSMIYLKIARANLKLARWDRARKMLRKIKEEFPDSFEAFTANQLLEEKKYFTVQVGAFLDQKKAEELVSELQSKGEYGYIVETIDKSGKKFYRVRVGESASLEKAKSLQSKLANIGYPALIYP